MQNPAHAGMNPQAQTQMIRDVAKPRSRGDEPIYISALIFARCKTPLTRG